MHGTTNDSSTTQLLHGDGTLARPVHIIASPFKTGTTSVGKALLDLGVGTRLMPFNGALLRRYKADFATWNACADGSAGFKAFRSEHGPQVLRALSEFTVEIAPFDVFHDAPLGHGHIHPFVCKVLAPRARFIWINRDFGAWVQSVRNWEVTHPEHYPRHEVWSLHPDRCIARRRKQWRDKFRAFRRMQRGTPKDCLALEWADLTDFTALARYYDVDAPPKDFPRENVSTQAESRAALPWKNGAPVPDPPNGPFKLH